MSEISQLETPIFMCTLAFPGMPTILHVFEPRYRLMIRRCIESSSPVLAWSCRARRSRHGRHKRIRHDARDPERADAADGRSMVETVGSHRFKLLEKGNLDGYTVGKIEM